jgi:hypothetical protein
MSAKGRRAVFTAAVFVAGLIGGHLMTPTGSQVPSAPGPAITAPQQQQQQQQQQEPDQCDIDPEACDTSWNVPAPDDIP